MSTLETNTVHNSNLNNIIRSLLGLISVRLLSNNEININNNQISTNSFIQNNLEDLLSEIDNLETIASTINSSTQDIDDTDTEVETRSQYLFHINYIFNDVDEKIDNKEKIKKLPSYKKIKKNDPIVEKKETCSICLNEYCEGKYKRELPCKHVFHKTCIDKWLKKDKHMTCPLCKTKYDNYI